MNPISRKSLLCLFITCFGASVAAAQTMPAHTKRQSEEPEKILTLFSNLTGVGLRQDSTAQDAGQLSFSSVEPGKRPAYIIYQDEGDRVPGKGDHFVEAYVRLSGQASSATPEGVKGVMIVPVSKKGRRITYQVQQAGTQEIIGDTRTLPDALRLACAPLAPF